jgi:hypothetical protein
MEHEVWCLCSAKSAAGSYLSYDNWTHCILCLFQINLNIINFKIRHPRWCYAVYNFSRIKVSYEKLDDAITAKICSLSESMSTNTVYDWFNTYTVGYATMNDVTTNECYNEKFLSIKSGCYKERDVARVYSWRVGLSRFH